MAYRSRAARRAASFGGLITGMMCSGRRWRAEWLATSGGHHTPILGISSRASSRHSKGLAGPHCRDTMWLGLLALGVVALVDFLSACSEIRQVLIRGPGRSN